MQPDLVSCCVFMLKCCLQCFDTVGWAAGKASGRKKLSGGVLEWLSVWSKVQTCIWPSGCHCHSLSLASVPFWYRLTRVVPDKGPLNRCVCVCVCVFPCGNDVFTEYGKEQWCRPEQPASLMA